MTGNHDDRNIRIGLAGLLKEFYTVKFRHFNITKRNIKSLFTKFFQALFSVSGFFYLISLGA